MFKRPFSFRGRIRRTEYWVSVMLYWFLFIFIAETINNNPGNNIALVALAMLIALLWFIIAQSSKRCHDLGRTAFWMFIPFYFIRMLFIEGGVRKNKYGDNPKGPNDRRLKGLVFKNLPER